MVAKEEEVGEGWTGSLRLELQTIGLPWCSDGEESGFLFVCSVAQSCLTLCDPLDCSTQGFPVLQHLLELAQTHVH